MVSHMVACFCDSKGFRITDILVYDKLFTCVYRRYLIIWIDVAFINVFSIQFRFVFASSHVSRVSNLIINLNFNGLDHVR